MGSFTLLRTSAPISLVGIIGVLTTACGAGTAAVVAGSGGGSGTTVQPSIAALSIEHPKEPARAAVRFALSNDATVQFFYQPLGAPAPLAMTQLGANPRALSPGAPPIPWNFALEDGLEAEPGASFHDRVRVFAIIPGIQEQVTDGANGVTLGLGNDPPVVHAVEPMPSEPQNPSESSGNVELRLRVSDSSADPVGIAVAFRRASDAPDAWSPATTSGVFPETIETAAAPGVEFSFFWNTNVDLAHEADSVFFRVTADDRTTVGTPLETQTSFPIDNNDEPIVQFDSGPVISNPDERRGIPLPFLVFDAEEDPVDVLFQWRRDGEAFPSLDTDGDGSVSNAEIDAIERDPVLRAAHHVATPYPRFASGLVVPRDAAAVCLPELARSEAWILASGVVGRALEILRPSSIPATPSWATNPLARPSAAVPLGDGLTALVLDAPRDGRLSEIELATGATVRTIAALGPGLPSALALERGGKAALVALDDAGTWRVERVELATGAREGLAVSGGSEPGPVRGIASLGTSAAVFTAGSALVHLDYRAAPRVGTLLPELSTPWGIAVGPSPSDPIFVSERGADRVLAVELDSHGALPVVVRTAELQPESLVAPEALALERQGSRLLAVASAPGGGRQLVGLDLGATGANRVFPIGAPIAADVAGLASGEDGLRLVCVPSADELRIAAGLEQRREITAYSPLTQDVAVDRPFDPVPSSGQPWRIAEDAQHAVRARANGSLRRFVWDSSDAGAGTVFLRALARDDEVGRVVDGASPKRVRAGLEIEPLTLGSSAVTNGARSIAAADLDGDGDQDIVSANEDGDNLTIFFQDAPGSFASTPLTLGGFPTTFAPQSVTAADFDGDGDQDLVSVNSQGQDLTVFFQLSPGSFSASPLRVGGFPATRLPRVAAAADLDGDGDQDIVSANEQGDDLTVFFQTSPGSFGAVPLRIPAGGFLLDLDVADFDGDGDLDIVTANLTVFFQVAPGSFVSTPLTLAGSGTTVAAADLDGDGDQDLVSGPTLFLQTAPGSFTATPLVIDGGASSFTHLPVVSDFDGDGDADIVAAINNGLTAFFQGPPGTFEAAPLALGGLSPNSIVAADLDGDGSQDLALTNGNNLKVFLQRPPASFAPTPLALGGFPTVRFPVALAAADLDADGDQDLVVANDGGDDLAAFFQLSPGSFGASALVLGGPDRTRRPHSVAAADLDGDGDLDLASANSDPTGGLLSNLTVFFQRSPGSFGPTPLTLGGFQRPESIAAADLDGDGDQDLVSSNAANFTIFRQLQPGIFASVPLTIGDSLTTLGPVSVVAADIDGDGDLDLASASKFGNDLRVFYQLAPGNFDPLPLTIGGFPTTNFPQSIVAADLDADGDVDLASANFFGGDVTVFFQLSPGTFSGAPLVLGDPGTTIQVQALTATDLDGDGDLDLVSANAGANTLAVFLQLQPGSFRQPLVLDGAGTLGRPVAVTAMDLDGDGDQDIVTANEHNHRLALFFGGR